jgi:phosphoribosylglycinamide formyltransferase-1
MKRLGILLSGRGSNFAAIQRAIEERALAAEIAVVISNRTSAPGLDLAKHCGLLAFALPAGGMERDAYDRQIIQLLEDAHVDLVCLAGYMRMLSARFVRAFEGRILNIHPSLLPAFPGLDAQGQALQHGVKVTGCTVHFVDEFLDAGPIVMQAAVPVLDEDTVDTLSARILAEEHRIFPLAIARVLSGKFRIEGRRVLSGRYLDERASP